MQLAIYNLLGERVRTLVDAKESAGVKQVTWDGRNDRGERVSSGVYLYRLEAGEFSTAKRLLLMK
ncbi:T9SS type A sorting domain-containing protein [candidate division KSB1 bacterium]|nr:T9SS type A sorting domain-containing protein [candidate division KSB1 bacterium]